MRRPFIGLEHIAVRLYLAKLGKWSPSRSLCVNESMKTVSALLTHCAAETSCSPNLITEGLSRILKRVDLNAKMGLVMVCLPNIRRLFFLHPDFKDVTVGLNICHIYFSWLPISVSKDTCVVLRDIFPVRRWNMRLYVSLPVPLSLLLHRCLLLSEWIQQVLLGRDELPLFDYQETQPLHN